MRFDGKVAVVTGGASGIGRATARMLADRGAAVGVIDLDQQAGERVVSDIAARGGSATFSLANVGRAADVSRAVDEVRRAFGSIDVLVVSAGVQRYGDAESTTDAEWEDTLHINLSGAWYAARACLPDMRGRGGAIVNVSSVQGLASQRNVLAYTVSKHGMIGLTRSMAVDYARENVRVNAVCPGTVDTPMLHWAASLDPQPQSVIEACQAMHPLGRIAEPEEIAEVVAFLAHERASFVTGAVWTVDGGLLTLIGGTPRTATHVT